MQVIVLLGLHVNMCGICGFNFEDKQLLERMCNIIKHRGPDIKGSYLDSTISIGIRLTNLINKKSTNYPLNNEEKDIFLICDGDIFNFSEIKSFLEKKGHKFYTELNQECIVHAYEEWGKDCINKFRGAFAFCIYDSKKKLLLLARDHLGIKTLYYYFDGERFIFGSEIKCILCYNVKREVNKSALGLFLSLKYVPFENTIFQGIKKVPSSSYLIFNLGSKILKIKSYWELVFNINKNKTEDQCAKELENLIIESVKIRLINDIPIGAFLSGGIDSSAVVGVLSKLVDKPIKTFSIGFEKGASLNETKFAKLVAEYNNTEHIELLIKSDVIDELPKIIWHTDDLFADGAIIPVFLMGKQVKEKLNLVFTGDGADEVFAGYSVYYRSNKGNFTKYIPQQIFSILNKFYSLIPLYGARFIFSYLKEFQNEVDKYIWALMTVPESEMPKVVRFKPKSVKSLIKSTFIKNLDIVNQFTNWDLKYQLPSLYNVKADRALSAASLIGRIPFLDSNLVAWSLTIPSKFKLKGDIEKYILRLAMKNYLPKEVLKRRKQGFGTPLTYWMNTGLKEFSSEIFEKLEKRQNLINPRFVKTIKRKRFNQIFQPISWNLITFELWYETYIENDGLKPIKY